MHVQIVTEAFARSHALPASASMIISKFKKMIILTNRNQHLFMGLDLIIKNQEHDNADSSAFVCFDFLTTRGAAIFLNMASRSLSVRHVSSSSWLSWRL